MKKIKFLFVGFVFSVISTRGDLILSNYDGTNVLNDASLVEYFSDAGDRWVTSVGTVPTGAWSLTSVILNLEMVTGDYQDIKVSIHTGGPIPVSFVADLQPDAPVTSTQSNYSFSPNSTTILNGGQSYVIIVEPEFVNGTAMYWYRSPDSNGGRVSMATGTTWGPWDIGFIAEPTYRIFADAVPEPSTLVLIFISSLTLCFYRKRYVLK